MSDRAHAAEDVRWRSDYNAARQEAQQTGRCLLLDFSTEWCTHCKRLDASTFRDPAVAKALNDGFIPVKLDGERERRLAEVLQIEGYPTLILAGPDGRIVRRIEGFVEANRFHDHLQGVLAAAANPEWMTRNYQEAAKAAGIGDHARAVGLLKTIVDDKQNRPIQAQARKQLEEIERLARVRFAWAKELQDRGQYLEAIDALSALLQSYAGTQTAAEATRSLSALGDKPEVRTQQRRRRAAELLAQAKNDFRGQHFLGCLERCETLAGAYGDLPEGAEGVQLLEQVRRNPVWMKAACNTLSDRLGDTYLALAESWVTTGQLDQAAECLGHIIQHMPATRHAERARIRLAQIQGRPMQQADYQGTGVRDQGSGVRGQESGVRSQGSGVGSQGSAARSQGATRAQPKP